MINSNRINPFVQAALYGLLDYDEGCCTLLELAAILAMSEPMLSPFNLECAAKEALRQEAGYRKEIAEAVRLAERREAEAALREEQAAEVADEDDIAA